MRTLPLVFFVAVGLTASGQNGSGSSGSAPQSNQAGYNRSYTSLAEVPDELRQELDRDAAALSKVPADPILKPDPLGPILEPFDRLTDRINQSARLKIGTTYTFVLSLIHI